MTLIIIIMKGTISFHKMIRAKVGRVAITIIIIPLVSILMRIKKKMIKIKISISN
jgi:hypothetical protein